MNYFHPPLPFNREGNIGLRGQKGETGPVGDKGYDGLPGRVGYNGDKGDQGKQSAQLKWFNDTQLDGSVILYNDIFK